MKVEYLALEIGDPGFESQPLDHLMHSLQTNVGLVHFYIIHTIIMGLG